MEDYDEELAALVRKNVAMLSEIQEDLCELQQAGDGESSSGAYGRPLPQILTLGNRLR